MFNEEAYEEVETIKDVEQPLQAQPWRLAKSLVRLRDECNSKAPKRSKAFDGTIGDSTHSARASRHNPNNAGVVCAIDITHDPANGMDTYALFDYIRQHPHPNCEYVISNRRIASRGKSWTSRAYTGPNPHSGHIHIGVGVGPDSEPRRPYDDDKTTWGVSKEVPKPKPTPFPYGQRVVKLDKPYMKGNDVLWIQQQINKLKTYPQNVTQHLNEDSIYGPATEKCVRVFQKKYGLGVDGIVGKNTWYEFRKQTNNL